MSLGRKRNRNSFVCTFCRRRKAKCDKGNPCSTCVKYNNPHCEYIKDPGFGAARKNFTGFVELGAASTTTAVPGEVHSELQQLKEKVLMLEHLVSVNRMPINTPLWQGSEELAQIIGYNPFSQDLTTFSFQNDYSPFLQLGASPARFYGPLSWVLLIKVDNAISEMFAFKHKDVLKRKISYLSAFKLLGSSQNPSDQVFARKVALSAYLHEPRFCKNEMETMSVGERHNERAKYVGLTTLPGGVDPRLAMNEKVELLLPSKRVIWMLVERFFKRLYVFFPFVDELDFKQHITRLVGPPTNVHEKATRLNVERKMDFLHLGLLLLILRFSYLTLFSNSEAVNEANMKLLDSLQEAQERRFLLENPIHIEVLDVAEECLAQFDCLRFCNLYMVQLCLYIKLYHMYAPEHGDVPEDSHLQLYTATLIHMAMSLGLHREPDRFKSKIRNPRTNNLCRKIWAFLLLLDLQGAMLNGLPMCTHRGMFDTKQPYHTPGNENVSNIEIEKLVVEGFQRMEVCYVPVSKVAALVSLLGEPLNMGELCTQLLALELMFFEDYKAFWLDMSCGTTCMSLEKTLRAKMYFEGSFLLVLVYFHFFNYYEREGQVDLSYFYLKKLAFVALKNMMPFYEDFVERSELLFEESTGIIITPGFQLLVQKSMIVAQALMGRLRFSILHCEMLLEHALLLVSDPLYAAMYETLKCTFNLASNCLKVLFDTFAKLSSRYYYSWRCVKALDSMRESFVGTEYYLEWCKGRECYMKLSHEMLVDLNSLLRRSLEDVYENRLARAVTLDSGLALKLNTVGSFDSTLFTEGVDFEENFAGVTEDLDNWWMQMLSIKPQPDNMMLGPPPGAGHHAEPPLQDMLPLNGLNGVNGMNGINGMNGVNCVNGANGMTGMIQQIEPFPALSDTQLLDELIRNA